MTRFTRRRLQELDEADLFGPLKSEFDLHDTLYFIGNSLGPPSARAKRRLVEVIEREWERDLVRSWNVNDWINLPSRVGAKIASLIGAAAHEVIVGDSTSIALFKLAAAAVALQGKKRIVTDANNFPTDLYVLSGLASFFGDVELVHAHAGEIADAIDDDTALVSLTHVDYKTSSINDMNGITAVAHARGALILWDLSHSVGTLPLALNEAGVDLAVGCTYKYLNGGPGSPAFSFVAKALQERLQPVIQGWMGHANPFAFSPQFDPAPGIRRLACGTPEVIALCSIEASLSLFENIDMHAVRAATIEMSDMFIALTEQRCAGFGLEIASPRDGASRGGHVSIRHPEGYAIMQALIAHNVIGDFRAPDLMRFGFSPLYQSFVDIWDAVDALREVLTNSEWTNERFRSRATVT